MKIAYASLAGKKNQKKNMLCQDVIGRFSFDTYQLVVLSDGAGSKDYARESAELMVRSTGAFFCDPKHRQLTDFQTGEFIQFINQEFWRNDLNKKNAGATLQFFLSDGNRYLIGHLGDGVILCGDPTESKVLSLPENGPVVNQTYLFPIEETADHFRTLEGTVSKDDFFVFSSDGMADLLYNNITLETAAACAKIAEWAREFDEEELEKILKDNLSSVFFKKTNDDIGIAVVYAD